MNVVPYVRKWAPYPINTTKGKVLPRTNSRRPARISSRPPNQIVPQLRWRSTIASLLNKRDKTYPVATPLPEAPLQPMRATDKGVKATRKPKRALFTIDQSLRRTACSSYAYTGVGLPKVFLRSPATAFFGDKYSFSNSSASMVTVLDRVLFSFIEEIDSSLLSWWLWVAIAIGVDERQHRSMSDQHNDTNLNLVKSWMKQTEVRYSEAEREAECQGVVEKGEQNDPLL
jgi:hypothetical protein